MSSLLQKILLQGWDVFICNKLTFVSLDFTDLSMHQAYNKLYKTLPQSFLRSGLSCTQLLSNMECRVQRALFLISNVGNRARPGFRALRAVDGPSALNPGTYMVQFWRLCGFKTCKIILIEESSILKFSSYLHR